MNDPSDDLIGFALVALDHAVDSVLGGDGPLVPFAMLDADGSRSLRRFAGDMEWGQAEARKLIRTTAGVERGAVAWDGFLTVAGERLDAVFVEASEAADPESVLLAQRYRPIGPGSDLQAVVGNPTIVRRGETLL